MEDKNIWWDSEREYNNTDVPCSVCGYDGKPIVRTNYDEEQIVCPNCGAKTRVYVGDYYDEGFMDGCWVIGQWEHGTLDVSDCDNRFLRRNTMLTAEERKNISKFIYMMGANGFDFNGSNIAKAIGANPAFDKECWNRLSDIAAPITTLVNQNNNSQHNEDLCLELKKLYSELTSTVLMVPSVIGTYQSGYVGASHDVAQKIKYIIDNIERGENDEC